MKRLFTFLLALLITVPLAACGTTSIANNSSDTMQEKVKEKESEAKAAPETKTEVNSYASNSKQKVTCSMCNGTGSVRYYYGDSPLEAALDGHDDYEYGPCSSCDGKGYTYVKVSSSSGNSSKSESSSKKICPSCNKSVSSLVTKKDAAGVSRTWCSGCWSDYNSIMGN